MSNACLRWLIRYDRVTVPLDAAFLVVITGSDSGEEVVSGETKTMCHIQMLHWIYNTNSLLLERQA